MPRNSSTTKGPPSSTKRPRTKCRVCNTWCDVLTAGHLRTHGLTVARYERMYGARRVLSMPGTRSDVGSLTDPPAPQGSVTDPLLPAKGGPPAGVSDPSSSLVAAVTDRMLDEKVWISCLADEVGERMMNGPLKQRLSYMLTTMLFQRAKVHGQSLSILSGALAELQEEWRMTQQPDGTPVDTDQILRVVDRAGKLVKESEEAVQRSIKLAMEEQRAEHEYADGIGPSLYQGTGEKLDMPAGVTSGDREIIRSLLGMVSKHANDENTIDVEQVPAIVPTTSRSMHPLASSRCPPGEGVGGTPLVTVESSPIGSLTDPTDMRGQRRRRRRTRPPVAIPPGSSLDVEGPSTTLDEV